LAMNEIIKFFIEVGKLKGTPRRGWVIREVKNPESIAEHTFRVAIMAWVLAGKKDKKMNIEKLLKMALIHDLCEVYSGDITPYDSILPKDIKKRRELLKTWPRFSESQKKKLSESKFKKEKAGLEKLIKNLPARLRQEMMHLWLDYENGASPEGRFFKHADRLESFLQAAEYWKTNKHVPQKPYWTQAEELHDDPVLLEFIEQIDKEFHKKIKPKA
ncbi:MAG: HD domain-containing protein, partial [Candidatus Staskawiczbacteria bacterium]|nr:HD domain-containing protein [Candidatus Staskawiczbacteria bacterium]